MEVAFDGTIDITPNLVQSAKNARFWRWLIYEDSGDFCQKNREIIQESSHLAVSHCGRGPSRKRVGGYSPPRTGATEGAMRGGAAVRSLTGARNGRSYSRRSEMKDMK